MATSLCEAEAMEKKVGILQVCLNENLPEDDRYLFKLTPITLKTVRPLMYKTIDLMDHYEEIGHIRGEIKESIEKYIDKTIAEIIKDSKKLLTDHPQQPKMPLIRLRIVIENADHLINVKRYGHKYFQKVANHEEMLLFKKNIKRLKHEKPSIDEDALDSAHQERDQLEKVEDVVERYFSNLTEERDKLKLFNFKCLSEVIRLYVDKEDEEGGKMLIKTQIDAACDFLNTNGGTQENSKELIRQFRDEKSFDAFETAIIERTSRKKDHPCTIANKNRSTKTAAKKSKINDEDDEEMDVENVIDDDDADVSIKAPAKAARGARGGSTRGKKTAVAPAAKKPTTRGRGKGKNQVDPNLSISAQLAAARALRNTTQQSATSSHSFMISSDED